MTTTRLIAGPGSGKTYQLVERVRALLESGVLPESIVVATYTRSAARELRTRLGVDERRTPWWGTLHSIAWRLLGGNLSVLSRREAEVLVADVRDGMPGFKGVKTKDVLKWVSEPSMRGPLDDAGHVAALVRTELRKANATTYDSLIASAALLQNLPRFSLVLIDEAQDLDPDQWDLVEALARDAELFVVADPRQAIMQWRGAMPERFMALAAEDQYLTVNRRSLPAIVELCNRLQPDYPAMTPLETGRPGEVERIEFGVNHIAAYVALIAACHRFANSDIAVLCRSNALLDDVCEAMNGAPFAWRRVGGREDLIDPVLQRARLTVNPHDDVAFALLYSGGPGDAQARARAAKRSCSLFTAMFDRAPEWSTISPDEPLTKWLVFVSAVLPPLAVSDWWSARAAEGYSLRSALVAYQFRDDQDDLTDADEVTLSTIHGAKGRERPCVIVFGASEGILPKSAAETADELREERNLLYVACSRAMYELHLVNLPGRQWSRFLCDIG